MRTISLAIFAAALAFTAPAVAGDHPHEDGCYRNTWFEPWLTGCNCTHPAIDDQEQHVTPEVHQAPPREPPHECPKGEYGHDYKGGDRPDPQRE